MKLRFGLISLLLSLSFATVAQVFASVAPVKDNLYGLSLCNSPQLKCISIKPNSNWYTLFPDAEKRNIVMRLNRTNVALKYRSWLVVPRHWKNVTYRSLSPFPQHIAAPGERVVYIDLKVFAFAAYDAQGKQVYWGPATGGKSWCDDLDEDCSSATGSYRIYRIQGENCESSRFPIETNGGAPMPYCMHYFKGFAIHGSTLMGFENRSRGCIRTFDDDAKWLNHFFVEKGTKVVVRD